MLVYIRHGHDDEDVEFSTHQDDVQLLKQGKELSRLRARRLVRYFGVPRLIRCSPFQRALDTARCMVDWIAKHKAVTVPIELDCSLSRLFNKDEQDDPDIAPSTAACKVPIKEKWVDFQKRVGRHVNRMVNEGWYDKEGERGGVWCISHSIVLLEVAALHHMKIRDPVQYLDWFDITTEPCAAHLEHSLGIGPVKQKKKKRKKKRKKGKPATDKKEEETEKEEKEEEATTTTKTTSDDEEGDMNDDDDHP